VYQINIPFDFALQCNATSNQQEEDNGNGSNRQAKLSGVGRENYDQQLQNGSASQYDL